MSIILKGELHTELSSIGCKAGDIIDSDPDTYSSTGVVHFQVRNKAITYNCSVWPDNYDIIPAAVRTCRVCGCTDTDCLVCIRKTGVACHWVETDLCSACVEPLKNNDSNEHS